jgi:uncharacterized iron-regulated membrane protein
MKVTLSPSTPTPTRPGLPRPNWRTLAFHAHRWLGLVVGVLLCIAGLTGSLLVLLSGDGSYNWWLAQRFGEITPTETKAAVPTIIENIRATYTNPILKFESLGYPRGAKEPYLAWFSDAADHHIGVAINPYTGQIMGDYEWETMWHGIIYKLHYSLLAGDTGILVMGIVALLTVILSITGIILWPGWRRLAAGFKIKWKGHIKRRNFDIHKVAGIATAVFLLLIGFTGFDLNVPQAHIQDAVYAVTVTPKPAEPVSRPIPNQQPLPLKDLLKRADEIFPDAKITSINFPHEPKGVLTVGKRQPRESSSWGNTKISFDRFSGEVVQLEDGLKPSRAKAILDQFIPLHFGTFAGIYSLILYFFVGLAPTVLLITGFIMWWHRRKLIPSQPKPQSLPQLTKP